MLDEHSWQAESEKNTREIINRVEAIPFHDGRTTTKWMSIRFLFLFPEIFIIFIR